MSVHFPRHPEEAAPPSLPPHPVCPLILSLSKDGEKGLKIRGMES